MSDKRMEFDKDNINTASTQNEELKSDEELKADAEMKAEKELNAERESTEAKNDISLTDIEDGVALSSMEQATSKKRNLTLYKILRIVFSVGFVVFAALFINEVLITPYRINKSIEKTNELYKVTNNYITEATPTPINAPSQEDSANDDGDDDLPVISKDLETVIDPNRDSQGRLLQFQDLLAVNGDVKGWITVPDSNINYVVMQSSNDDPDYYLTRDIDQQELKAGSLYLDYKCSIENNSQNLTIHGHNMTSTDNMFHYLIKYKELDYYKVRPVITFDSLYQTGQWKIFSVFITNGTSKKEKLFNYTISDFSDSSDFLNFVYDLRIRSMYHIEDVDINENDQLLTLSTCSYEVKDYRTVIVARRVREGEDSTVNVNSVTMNEEPLYPYTYYYRYGGKAPSLTKTFEEALENGEIHWYTPVKDSPIAE